MDAAAVDAAARRPSLAEAVTTLPEAARLAAALPERERREALRVLLRESVHDVAMRATVDTDTDTDGGAGQLAELAAAVRAAIPEGAEDDLNPRTTVFVRLLRRDALEPAWLLANDNASGVVQAARTVSTWAGGSTLSTRLPLPTLVDPSGDVYAWLPGFRDPRFDVPDSDYDITARVVLRQQLDQALLRDGVLHLFGSAYLGQLQAGPDDHVSVRWSGPRDADDVVVPARRGRRPDLVQPRGPELTRLAWGGWSAQVELAAFARHLGVWRAELEVVQQGVRRHGPLGTRRGPLAGRESAQVLIDHGRRFCLDDVDSGDVRDGLTLRVERSGPLTSVVAQPARRALRHLRAKAAVTPPLR